MTALRTSRNSLNPSMDLWGNVRIPDIDSLMAGNSNSSDDWIKVNHSGNTSYSSLLGLPVIGVPSSGNSSYEVTSRYSVINCFNITYATDPKPWNILSGLSNSSSWGNRPATFSMTASGPNTNFNSTALQYFLLLSVVDEGSSLSAANCSVGLRDVDSKVLCHGQNCQVDSMRLSKTPVDEQTLEQFSSAFVMQTNLWYELPFASIGYKSHAALGSIEGSSITEQWINDPNTDFSNYVQLVNISALDQPSLNSRLQQVYNTFWQSTYGGRYFIGNLSSNLSYYDNAEMDLFGSSGPFLNFNTSQASVINFDGEIYQFHWIYGVLLFITSLMLLAAGISSLVLKLRTLAPDILGYTSTNTRDNAYFAFHKNFEPPSYLNGLERTRALHNLRVIIADVSSDSSGIGHIAFVPMGPGSQRLMKGREYD
jgi:hypothetical protein